MEIKSISSLTEYIESIKEILNVSNKDINKRMNKEYMDLFNSIYSDNKTNSYIKEYEKRKILIQSKISELIKKKEQYLRKLDFNTQDNHVLYNKLYDTESIFIEDNLLRLYNELDILNKEIELMSKSRPMYKVEKEVKNNVFYYRGQHGAQYDLVPKIMRKQNINNESKIYHEIMVNCATEFKALSHLDKLVLMQHYGCPTRLLDVTKNPLVALYFACKNFNCNDCKQEKNGKVYIFAIPEDDVTYSDSDRGLMLSCLPKFSKNDKNKLLDKCEEYIYLGKNFDEKCHDEIVERFLHEIRRELPAFRKVINPKDLVDSIIIQPNKSNARILRQDGAFIISGLSRSAKEEKKKLDSKVYAVITIKNKESMEDILHDLNILGINEATLFPEVDNVAHYLQEDLMP